LARESTLRASVVAAAERRAAVPLITATATNPETASERDIRATENLRTTFEDVGALGLPIGWVWPSADNVDDRRRVPQTVSEILMKLIGLLLTGFAISQGAPFWFDLLNKVMVIRSTVKPAEKSHEQPSKDRPAPRTEIETDGTMHGEPSKG
jgi:hypothetical protein